MPVLSGGGTARAVVGIAVGIAAVSVVANTVAASSTCDWLWECPVDGSPCVQVAVCSSRLQQVPPKPPGVPPIAPPDTQPILPRVIPPIGTEACYAARFCTHAGGCHWEAVCE